MKEENQIETTEQPTVETMPEPIVMTEAEFAEKVKAPLAYVRRLRKAGKLRVQMYGRIPRYTMASVEHFFEVTQFQPRRRAA